MFKYKKISEHEIQISDFPYGLITIPFAVSIFSLYSIIFSNANIANGLIILTISLLSMLIFTKKDTNINFNTHKISHYKRNLFIKKHSMIDIKDIEVKQVNGSGQYLKIPTIALKDQSNIYTIIDLDIVQKKEKQDLYKSLKSEFIKHQ